MTRGRMELESGSFFKSVKGAFEISMGFLQGAQQFDYRALEHTVLDRGIPLTVVAAGVQFCLKDQRA